MTTATGGALQTYAEYAPTPHDPRGAFLPEQGDWLVLPAGRNRDSDLLSESNWAAALEQLGGEGEDVEVHRFGHWACGWLEIILVRPGTDAADTAERIAARLADYPVLDEEDYSRREYESTLESIDSEGRRMLSDTAPENWAAQVYGWLSDNGHDSDLEPRDGSGGYPEEESIKTALAALGWLDPEWAD